jgi:DNA mismatch endonuclease, patch repair protein
MPDIRADFGTLFGVADHLSALGRSRVMAQIRSKDTKPELAIRRGLFAREIRGWRCHTRFLPGKPDVAFTRWKVAVFIDGAFWHGHPDHFTFGKSGAYWDAKIARTQERDRVANSELESLGWVVLRFWDFEVKENLTSCLGKIIDALQDAGRPMDATEASALVA